MADRDHYEVLGVARGASADEIKKAYRRLARQLHPDANHGKQAVEAEAEFKAVVAAYETLSDPERRARYDRFGHDGSGSSSDPFGGFGDIFETFFGGSPFGGGGGRRRSGPTPGEDLETTLEVEFEAAIFGSEEEVSVRTAVACIECEATGAVLGSGPETCGGCRGSGQVQRVRQSMLGQMVTAAACPTCSGRGQVITDPCGSCRGEGRVVEDRSFTVNVRAGVDEGTTLRLGGRGAVGPRGGPAGDLYVRLQVKSHPVFERHGFDLVHRLQLPMTQAALGVILEYETLDGVEELRIPRGTSSGEVFRFRGRGVPHLEGRGRGDLLVE
ncbi:MAG TPA: molecular chaperone DnaJ, partial [Acidimicrobiaceae bacterium]|nr:molecular chaperone DnaJ [Acidimicrobiaceae bacterium]